MFKMDNNPKNNKRKVLFAIYSPTENELMQAIGKIIIAFGGLAWLFAMFAFDNKSVMGLLFMATFYIATKLIKKGGKGIIKVAAKNSVVLLP